MSIEGSQPWVDRPESSDGEDRRNKKGSKAPIPPHLLFERIDIDDDDDEDEEETEKKDAHDEVSPESPDAVDTEAESTDAAEVFESAAEGESSEFMDIPHIDADKRPADPTFEEMMEREMSPEFVSAISAPELGGPDRPDTPPIPSWEMPEVGSTFDPGPGEEDKDDAASRPAPYGGTSFWGSVSPSAPFETVDSKPAYTPAAASSSGERGVSSGFTAALETLKAASELHDMITNPYPHVTKVLTELVVGSLLAERKQQRYNNEPLLHKQNEQIVQLQDAQRRANERVDAHFRNEAAQAAQATGEQIFDQEGNEIILQPGWRVERSAGGYSVVLDEHNRIVHNAIRYGEAFQRDQKREQLSDDLFAALKGGASVGVPTDTGFGPQSAPADLPSSAQHGQDWATPGQHEAADLRHRLPEPRNPLASAVASPWLWTAVAVLIIVYFVAALA